MRSMLILSLFLVFQSGTSQSIKVISFNIRFDNPGDGNNQWSLRKSDVIDFINYEEADFLGMQEVLLSQLNDLKRDLDQYESIGVARDDGKERGEFSPILYYSNRWKLLESQTFWLSETPDTPSKDWDAALPRICTWGKFEHQVTENVIYVFNTHYDHRGTESRLNASKLIIDQITKIAEGKQVVLVGDFNAEPDSQPIRTILNRNMNDAFSSSSISFGCTGTFNGFNYEEDPKRRIDYVFFTQDFTANKYAVASQLIEGRYLSDHFPVIVQLRSK